MRKKSRRKRSIMKKSRRKRSRRTKSIIKRSRRKRSRLKRSRRKQSRQKQSRGRKKSKIPFQTFYERYGYAPHQIPDEYFSVWGDPDQWRGNKWRGNKSTNKYSKFNMRLPNMSSDESSDENSDDNPYWINGEKNVDYLSLHQPQECFDCSRQTDHRCSNRNCYRLCCDYHRSQYTDLCRRCSPIVVASPPAESIKYRSTSQRRNISPKNK